MQAEIATATKLAGVRTEELPDDGEAEMASGLAAADEGGGAKARVKVAASVETGGAVGSVVAAEERTDVAKSIGDVALLAIVTCCGQRYYGPER